MFALSPVGFFCFESYPRSRDPEGAKLGQIALARSLPRNIYGCH